MSEQPPEKEPKEKTASIFDLKRIQEMLSKGETSLPDALLMMTYMRMMDQEKQPQMDINTILSTKTQLSKIDTLKEIIRAWGMNPEEILTRKALTTPHRVYEQPYEMESEQVAELRNALKQMVRKELLDARNIE